MYLPTNGVKEKMNTHQPGIKGQSNTPDDQVDFLTFFQQKWTSSQSDFFYFQRPVNFKNKEPKWAHNYNLGAKNEYHQDNYVDKS